MANLPTTKLFYDLEAAKAFGEEVDHIAKETMVATGDTGTPNPIFMGINAPYSEIVGEHHHIRKDVGSRDQDTYYVEYYIYAPPNALKANVVLAEREAKEYLAQKYQELGPDAGVSRA